MRRLILSVLIGAMLLWTPLAIAGDLVSIFPFGNAVNWTCDGVTRTTSWTNDWGADYYIKQMQVWIGAAGGQVSDIWFHIYRGDPLPPWSRYSSLGFSNWDHYRDPDNLHYYLRVYSPDYVSLLREDRVSLEYRCTHYGGGTPVSLMVTFLVTQGVP
jgi:hypothetical protein